MTWYSRKNTLRTTRRQKLLHVFFDDLRCTNSGELKAMIHIRVRQTKCTSGWFLVEDGYWFSQDAYSAVISIVPQQWSNTYYLLIDPGKPEPIEMMEHFVYWIDPSKPKISFRAAMKCPYHLYGMYSTF